LHSSDLVVSLSTNGRRDDRGVERESEMRKTHIVEIHIGKDVLSKDYGSETAALRAASRLADAGHNVRYWYDGVLVLQKHDATAKRASAA
jgi:hypothetical protein